MIVKNSTYDECVIEGCKDMSYSKIAQGLAGLQPWVMARAPMWADDWREGLDPRNGVPNGWAMYAMVYLNILIHLVNNCVIDQIS